MSSIAEALRRSGNLWWIAFAGFAALIIVASEMPGFHSSRQAANQVREYTTYAPTVALSAKAPTAGRGSISAAPMEAQAQAGVASVDAAIDRKMVRTSELGLVVKRPSDAAENIRRLAERQSGYVVNSDVSGGAAASAGSLTIRVPAARFEETWAELRKLGLRIESEKMDAQDVTRQYVDKDASLRNLQAEEAQYRTIMKQAGTVKDMLAVSEKLAEVRGQIELQQAEFNALSKQIETVAITVSLRAESEAQVFGLQWRPLYQMKLALRDGLDAVAGYAGAMTAILFYLPAVLLWMVTIGLGAMVGWKILRWAGRVFFAWPKQSTAQNE